ncbi:MAG: PQQ-binding-like beta-propeller repeat protein [Vicinamibacterales bacterium]
MTLPRLLLRALLGLGISLTIIAGLQRLDGTVAAQSVALSPTFLASQATSGKQLFDQQCASCHGSSLDNGEFGPPLSGEEFLQKWGNHPLDEVFDVMSMTMPPGAPGSLSADQATNLLAYVLQRNAVAISDKPLPSDPDQLHTMVMPTPTNGFVGGLANGVALPPPPNPTPNPLDRITPVTEAMLRQPADADWLTWRRTPDAMGFSPLRQITRDNVGRMQVTWAWALPNGPNEATPIVHDGVMFVYGYGDVVQALNAANGDLLWQYTRRLPKGVAPSFKKTIAIYGDHVFMATSDVHMVALDVKTGAVKWDTKLVPGAIPQGMRMIGGPLVAKGKVIVGTAGGASGGNYIVALDAQSGKEAWRFDTIPKPGTPGGDSWNGLPVDKRSGASVWNPGSYDPQTNLVFFGPSPTYDTAPLRDRVDDPRFTNDALYTNCTVALDVDSGRLVWFYSHMPNDQWDLDFAFERQILDLRINGTLRHVVATAGKIGIFDLLDAKTGEYLTSMDLGFQTLVKSVDPKTGAKTIDRERITPGDGEAKYLCPHSEGGKNWIPNAFNPVTKLMFVPLVESCQDLAPVAPGERGLLSTGVRLSLRPPPNTDGNYGRLEAINLETKKSVWVNRRRATSTTGVLSTAGGVVFAGYVDRTFAAFDDQTGTELWRTRLTDVPNSNAISYAVNGRQYIAVVAGNGGNHARLFMRMMPEIKNPANRSASVWVFEVADAQRGGAPR